MPRLSRLLHLALGALLLAALQVALLHPLQHVDAQGAFVHVPGGGTPHTPGGRKAPAWPQCEVLASITACLASAPQIAVAATAGVETIHTRSAARLSGDLSLAYRSQAPPPLL